MTSDTLTVRTVESTDQPEKLMCTCARGDYNFGSVHPDEVSFEELMDPIDGESIEEKKNTLISHLLRSGHWGVFEHPQITLEIEGMSRSCMAQLTRHRQWSFDVMSHRYVDVKGMETDELFKVPPSTHQEEIVSRDGTHESTQEEIDEREKIMSEAYEDARSRYNRLRELGMPAEDARFVLPMGSRTNLRMSGNARDVMHVMNVRLKGDVQWEAFEAVEGIRKEFKEWMPNAYERFERRRPIPLAP